MNFQALANWQWPYDIIQLLPMAPLALGMVIALVLLAMGKRRAGAIAIIFFLGLTGGGMVFGFDREDTGRQWYSRHLKVVQDQLAELSDRLRSYKARHGRYPTNDEHLGVLDDFQLRFPLPVRPVEDERRNPSGIRWMGDWHSQDTIARLLRQTVGRPLARQQEEAESLCLTADMPGIEIAMGKRDTILVFRDGLACSPWGIPYMYENRTSLAASAFADSPATHPDGRYSLKVDDGIYLWCISAKGPAGELAVLEMRKSVRQVAGWVIIALFVAALLWLTFRICPGLGCAGWLAMLISLPAGAVMTTIGTTCYVMIPFFSRRDPATIAAQQELLAKYRDAGVITDATYRRALAAANPAPPASPASTTQATTQATQPLEGR